MSVAKTTITVGMLEAAFRLAEELNSNPSYEERVSHLTAFSINADVEFGELPAVDSLANLIWNRDRILLERAAKKPALRKRPKK